MPHPSPKDNVALHPIPYNWSMYFIRDATKKTIALKPDAKFDQNEAMHENSHLASTSNYNKEDTSNHIRMVPILHPTKKEKMSSINALSMKLLLFTLNLSLTCTSTQKM